MGSAEVCKSIKSTDVRRGFESLVSEATYDYGNDSYNGTISTCSLARCEFKFDKYTPANEKKAIRLIESSLYRVEKGTVHYIDLGVIEYRVIEVKKEKNPKFNPKYKLQFVVRQKFKDYDLEYFEKQKQAEDFAAKKTLETGCIHVVTKEYILAREKGVDNKVSATAITTKSYKSKPKLKDMPNRKIEEIHKYIFFGWAYS